jgi:integrase
MPRLKSVVARYAEEVTPTKKGSKQERGRASLIIRSKLADEFIDRIDGAAIARYRDQRLTQVSNNTVRLELAFLSVVFEQCRREWGLGVSNPVRQIRMPKPGKPRQRRLEVGEEAALLQACRVSGAYYLETFVILAVETGMRFGELAAICREHVNLRNQTIHLADTKNGHHRTVPLTTRAVAALQALPTPIEGRVFNLQPGSIRSAFLTAVARAKAVSGGSLLVGFRFHDLRHEAVSRLFEKGLNPIEVGMISGHRTMAMLQRYAHLSPASLVAKLG